MAEITSETKPEETVEITSETKPEETPEINMEEIQKMVNKGLETKSNAILNSYAKQLGIDVEEIRELYKEKRAKADEEKVKNSDTYKSLETELSNLKESIKKEKQNAVINKTAKEFGYSEEQIQLITKLLDMEKITDENIEAELKAQFEVISKQLPAVDKKPNLGFNGKTEKSKLNTETTVDVTNRKRWNKYK